MAHPPEYIVWNVWYLNGVLFFSSNIEGRDFIQIDSLSSFGWVCYKGILELFKSTEMPNSKQCSLHGRHSEVSVLINDILDRYTRCRHQNT